MGRCFLLGPILAGNLGSWHCVSWFIAQNVKRIKGGGTCRLQSLGQAQVKAQVVVVGGTVSIWGPKAEGTRVTVHVRPRLGKGVLESTGLSGTSTFERISDQLYGALLCSGAEGGSVVSGSISSWMGLVWALQSPPHACHHQEGSAPRSGFQVSRSQWEGCRRPRPFPFPLVSPPPSPKDQLKGQTGKRCLFLSLLERLPIRLPHCAGQNSPVALCLFVYSALVH